MRKKTRKDAGPNDALIAAILRGPGTPPPPSGHATPEEVEEASWALYNIGEPALWVLHGVAARARAVEWNWAPDADGCYWAEWEFHVAEQGRRHRQGQ
jgi:hypothetical protein